MTARSRWFRFWVISAFLLTAVELWQVFRGQGGVPLTTVARARILGTVGGSAAVGAVLVWLARHWLFDVGGLDWWDGLFALIGALVGMWGHGVRRAGAAA